MTFKRLMMAALNHVIYPSGYRMHLCPTCDIWWFNRRNFSARQQLFRLSQGLSGEKMAYCPQCGQRVDLP